MQLVDTADIRVELSDYFQLLFIQEMLLLKATSTATLSCLEQCLSLLQRQVCLNICFHFANSQHKWDVLCMHVLFLSVNLSI